MVDGLDASKNTRKGTVKPPIPAFSITSQHKGILEEQGLLPFLKTDQRASSASRRDGQAIFSAAGGSFGRDKSGRSGCHLIRCFCADGGLSAADSAYSMS